MRIFGGFAEDQKNPLQEIVIDVIFDLDRLPRLVLDGGQDRQRLIGSEKKTKPVSL